MKPANEYKHLSVPYVINILIRIYVYISGTLVAFLREVLYVAWQ